MVQRWNYKRHCVKYSTTQTNRLTTSFIFRTGKYNVVLLQPYSTSRYFSAPVLNFQKLDIYRNKFWIFLFCLCCLAVIQKCLLYSPLKREIVVCAGSKANDVAETFGVTSRTVYRLMKKGKEHVTLKYRPRSSHPRVTDVQTDTQIVRRFRAH